MYKLWKNHARQIILLHHLYYGLCHLQTHVQSLNTMLKTELAQEAGMPNGQFHIGEPTLLKI